MSRRSCSHLLEHVLLPPSDQIFFFSLEINTSSQMGLRPSVLGYSNISCFIFFSRASKIKTSKVMFFFSLIFLPLYFYGIFFLFPPLSCLRCHFTASKHKDGQSLEDAEVNLSAASKTLRDYLTQEDASAGRQP